MKSRSFLWFAIKRAREMRNRSAPKVNCSFPRHMLNYLWTSAGISRIFAMETDTILQCMHTHRGEQLPWHPAPLRLEAFRQFHSTANRTLCQPSVYHSTLHSTFSSSSSSSLLLFLLLLSYFNTILPHWSRGLTFYHQRTRFLQGSGGAALSRVVTEGRREKKISSAGIPRDAQRWTGIARTQAGIYHQHCHHHYQAIPPPRVRAAAAAAGAAAAAVAAAANQERRGEKCLNKKKKSRRGGLLYQEQKHYIIGCLCGRVGEGWTEGREVLRVAALSLSLLSSYRCTHKSKFNINHLLPLEQTASVGGCRTYEDDDCSF